MKHIRGSASKIQLPYTGYGLIWTSNLICFQSTVLFPSSPHSLELINVFFSGSIFSCIVFHFLFAFIACRVPDFFRRKEVIFGIVALMSAGFCIVSLCQYLPDGWLAILLTGAALHGMGSAGLDVSWLDFYGRLEPDESRTNVIVAFAFSFILWFLIVFLSPFASVGLVANLILIACSGILLTQSLSRSSSFSHNEEKRVRTVTRPKIRSLASSLANPLIGSLAFAIAYSFFDRITSTTISYFEYVHKLAILFCLVFVLVLLLIIWRSKSRISIDRAVKLIFPLLVIGCLLLPLMNGLQSAWSTVLVAGGFMTYDILMVILVAELSYETTLNGAFVEGIVRGLIWCFCGAGGTAGYYIAQISPDAIVLTVASIALLYIIIFGFGIAIARNRSLHFSPGDEEEEINNEQNTSSINESNDEFEQKILRLANNYGLTRREEEVVAFLVRGRTLSYIAEEMIISEHTVRAHTRHIYEKMDVHTRQELIDLFDNT